MGNCCISIENKVKRDAVVAVLTGDTDKVRSLIKAIDKIHSIIK